MKDNLSSNFDNPYLIEYKFWHIHYKDRCLFDPQVVTNEQYGQWTDCTRCGHLLQVVLFHFTLYSTRLPCHSCQTVTFTVSLL